MEGGREVGREVGKYSKMKKNIENPQKQKWISRYQIKYFFLLILLVSFFGAC